MLVDFSVKNYLSFKESVTFSMIASPDKTLWDTNVIENAQGTGLNLLKSAIIYGHNASGKSNLIKALYFFSKFISDSMETRVDLVNEVKPFKIDTNQLSEPSIFDAKFILNGTIFQYGFSVNGKHVCEEWLYSFPKTQKRNLFNRVRKENGYDYNFGSHFKGDKKSVERLTRDNSLFLTVAGSLNNETAKLVHSFFSKLSSTSFVVATLSDFSSIGILNTLLMLQNVPRLKDVIKNFLTFADTGLIDFEYPEDDISFERFLDEARSLRQHANIDDKDKRSFQGSPFGASDIFSNFQFIKSLKTIHRTVDYQGKSKNTLFSISEESDGTTTWFSMAGPINLALNYGDTIVKDEFDLRLHPMLSRELVSMFHNEKVNPKNAQFVGTTHNTDLLDKDLLRRDQIWFTEKKHDTGATDLYSLWDFKKKPRKEEDYRKNYLSGRYGAIPILEKFEL